MSGSTEVAIEKTKRKNMVIPSKKNSTIVKIIEFGFNKY